MLNLKIKTNQEDFLKLILKHNYLVKELENTVKDIGNFELKVGAVIPKEEEGQAQDIEKEVPVQGYSTVNINHLRIKNGLGPIPNGEDDLISSGHMEAFLKEFSQLVRKENKKRRSNNVPPLQYSLCIEGKTYQSKSDTASTSS